MNVKFRERFNGISITDALKSIDFAIFDLDGTIYPRMMLIDLVKFEIKKGILKDKNKIKLLDVINFKYKNGEFKQAYLLFVELLKDEDRTEYINSTKLLIKNSYVYAKLTIEKLLRKYNIKSYLISITSDFISEVTKDYFCFENTFSIKYNYLFDKNKYIFTGETSSLIDNPQDMKFRLYKELNKNLINKKFIYFFDSIDDIKVASESHINVGVNPEASILNSSLLDYLLIDTNDPWENLYNQL